MKTFNQLRQNLEEGLKLSSGEKQVKAFKVGTKKKGNDGNMWVIKKNKNDFNEFVNSENSFSPVNMFFCKKKNKLEEFYETLFSWLKRCENVFGFDLQGYGRIRIYAFLCERFLPYWFNKNSKVLEWPIIFHDLRKEVKNEK